MSKENVSRFMELFNSNSSLQKSFADAEASYPGSLEIREAVVEDLVLPMAEQAGFPFTVEELRKYETSLYLSRHRDEEQDPDEPDDDTFYFLLDHGWTNDNSIFHEDPSGTAVAK